MSYHALEEIDPAMLAGLFALGGVLIGGFFPFIGNCVVAWLNNRSAEKRKRRELAMVHAEKMFEAQFRAVELSGGKEAIMKPISSFYIFAIFLVDKLQTRSPKRLKQSLSQLSEVSDITDEWLGVPEEYRKPKND